MNKFVIAILCLCFVVVAVYAQPFLDSRDEVDRRSEVKVELPVQVPSIKDIPKDIYEVLRKFMVYVLRLVHKYWDELKKILGYKSSAFTTLIFCFILNVTPSRCLI